MKVINKAIFAILLFSLMVSCKKNSGAGAAYDLYGSPGECTFTLNGTFNSGVILDSVSQYVVIKVNAKETGNYSITTSAINGIQFSGAGTFAATGDTSIRLTATGKPEKTGVYSFLIPGDNSFCRFNVRVTEATTYTLNCSNPIIEGDYIKDSTLNPTNRISFEITSTGPGDIILSGTANGMEFIGHATFITAGTDMIILSGSGTPLAAGETSITLSGGNVSCDVKLQVN